MLEPGLQISFVAPPSLPGFEQWLVHQTPEARPLSAHLERHAVTTQAPGAAINCVARVRGKTYENSPAILQCYNPGDFHACIRIAAPESYYLALFSSDLIEGAAESRGLPARTATVFRPQVAVPEARTAFRELHDAVRRGDDDLVLEEALESALDRYLGFVCESRFSIEDQRVREPRRVARVREVLHERFSENVTLGALAEAAGVHRCHLLRCFKAELGVTPRQYLLHLRIAKARRLLARGMTATRAAVEVGFADQSHLHRHFKRALGVTPGAYAAATSAGH